MRLFTILIFFLRVTFWLITTFAPTAFDRSVRAGLELDRFKRWTLLEPYFYDGSATPVIDLPAVAKRHGAHFFN